MNDKHEDALRALYQKSRQEQPSAQLDQRIRKAAQRRLYRTRKRWIWGLSTAAVLVLSFNVVLNLVQIEPASQEVFTEEKSRSAPLSLDAYKAEKEHSTDSVKSLHRSFSSAPAAPVIKPDKPALMEQKKSMQKLKRRSLAEPAPSEERMAEQDFSSGLVVADSIEPQLIIPQLPARLEQLLKLDSDLSGEKTAAGLITIYFDNKLILTLFTQDRDYVYKAWPGAEKLGVKVNWNIKPAQLDKCTNQNVYISCSLNDRVQGLFEEDRLDHISWKVTSDR